MYLHFLGTRHRLGKDTPSMLGDLETDFRLNKEVIFRNQLNFRLTDFRLK